MDENRFKEMILNGKYILWLSKIMQKYEEIDDIYFVRNHKISEEDQTFISYLEDLFLELNKFVIGHKMDYKNIFSYFLKYNGVLYNIYSGSEGFSCRKVDINFIVPYVEYKDLKEECRKNMKYNFNKLSSRVMDALYNSDLEKINYELSKIDGPTMISAVGGSSVVAEFATKILSKKNHIITTSMEPNDFKGFNVDLYKNVLACSYSGSNYWVELAFSNKLKRYLLSGKENTKADVNLTYNIHDEEYSFISLGATLIPCSILLNYYLNGEKKQIVEKMKPYKYNFDVRCDAFEIFTDIATSTASKYLESTMVESGIGLPIIHGKYSYCHGRSTLSTTYNNIAIYFNLNTELDKLLIGELHQYYKEVIILNAQNDFMSEFNLLLQCMYLTEYIAEQKNIDLSGVNYNPIAKKLYKYRGGM